VNWQYQSRPWLFFLSRGQTQGSQTARSSRASSRISRTGYERIEPLARETLELIAACPCSDGCPACVQSPHCGNANEPLDGNANEPLDKGRARELLATLLSDPES